MTHETMRGGGVIHPIENHDVCGASDVRMVRKAMNFDSDIVQKSIPNEEIYEINGNITEIEPMEHPAIHDHPLSEKVDRMCARFDQINERIEKMNVMHHRPALSSKAEKMEFQNHSPVSAIKNYLKFGQEDQTLETKAMSVGSPVGGGYLVPQKLYDQIIDGINSYAPFRQIANVIQTASDTMDVVVDYGDTSVAWSAETSARAETNTTNLTKITIPSQDLYASPRITQRLIDDSAFDIESWIAERIAASMGIAEQTAFINGTLSTQPKGLLTYPAGVATTQIEELKTGVAGAFPATNPADVLYTLMGMLESQYIHNATWIMNRKTLSAIRQFKDTSGQYLLQTMLGDPSKHVLMGYPVVLIEQMPNMAAGSKSIAFGDFKAAYTITDRQDISITRNPYTERPYVVFYAVKRVGGAVTNTRALKILNFSV